MRKKDKNRIVWCLHLNIVSQLNYHGVWFPLSAKHSSNLVIQSTDSINPCFMILYLYRTISLHNCYKYYCNITSVKVHGEYQKVMLIWLESEVYSYKQKLVFLSKLTVVVISFVGLFGLSVWWLSVEYNVHRFWSFLFWKSFLTI